MHRQGGVVHGGREREVAIAQATAFAERSVAARKVEPGATHIAALLRARLHQHALALAQGVFLDDDGIGALRHDPAGENTGGLAGAHAAGEGMARGDLADHPELGRHLGDVG
jgi:hypothetical protein